MDQQWLFERWREGHRTDIEREVRLRCAGMSYGKRMLALRHVMGATQKVLTATLGVSTRIVIRHERGQLVRAWEPIWAGIRELERDHEELLGLLEAPQSQGLEFN
jgi:hypothetical protein